MNAFSPFRIAIAVLTVVAAYFLGRLHRADSNSPGTAPTEILETEPAPEPGGPEAPALSRAEKVRLDASAVAEAARTMSMPDGATHTFFENLDLEDLPVAVGFIEGMPAGNEQDALFLMAMRQWARLDGPGALNRAAAFPSLGTRSLAQETVYNIWASHDSEAALLRAIEDQESDQMIAAVAAVVAGAATREPKGALALWNIAPRRFLDSPASQVALEQLVESAYGTGKKEEVRQLIEELPHGVVQTVMANSLAGNWARHYPDDAYAWVQRVLPPGDDQNAVTENLFTAMTQRDPEMAANWTRRALPVEKQPMFLANAVARWAQLDVMGAEIWMNEQPGGPYMDGASFALAKHFLESGQMKDSFAWIRRVYEDRNRAELLVRLGRRWSAEEPQEFQRFLAESSLSQIEVEILTSGIDEKE